MTGMSTGSTCRFDPPSGVVRIGFLLAVATGTLKSGSVSGAGVTDGTDCTSGAGASPDSTPFHASTFTAHWRISGDRRVSCISRFNDSTEKVFDNDSL